MQTFKRISAIFLAVIILTLSLPTATVFAADTDMNYGRKCLSQMSNGDNLVAIYDLLVDGCNNLEERIDIPDEITVYNEEVKTVYAMFYSDYPEYFWVLNGTPACWSVSSRTTAINPIYDDNIISSDIDAMRIQLDNKVSELASGLDGKTDYEKSKILHDRLCATTVYEFGQNNQNSYGALIEGEAVCNGYARAYQLLLKKVGISAWYVRGTSRGVGHAWNLVKIDNNWYYTDATWDDTDDFEDFFNNAYEYFNITTEELLKDHTIDSSLTDFLPNATATEANYYVKEDLIFNTFDAERLARALKRNEDNMVQASVIGDPNDFYSEFYQNADAIAELLGSTDDYTFKQSMFKFQGNDSYVFVVDYDITVACNHKYTNNCDKECNLCGDIRTISHTYGNWITSEEPTCVDTGSRYMKCSVCGNTITENLAATGNHRYESVVTNPTCTAQGYTTHTCSVCGNSYKDTYVAKLGHSYDNACDTSCNVCGTTRTPSAHVYDNIYDADCNVCGDTREAAALEWQISSTNTGVYSLKPNKNYTGNFAVENIAVYDKNGKEVYYYEKLGGFPLVADQEYTVKFRYDCSDEISGTVIWNKTKKADKIFPDTYASEWYNNAIAYVVGRNIMSGYGSTGLFGTADNIQRQDFMVMLARLDGVDLSKYVNKTSPFSDVPNSSDCYYKAAVIWGYENGIVSGYANGKFGTGDKITREQLVKFLYNYANYKGLDTSYSTSTEKTVKNKYKDYKNVSDWAQDAVLWAIENNVIKGKTDTTIVPYGNALRCEVAQIMYNIFLNDLF